MKKYIPDFITCLNIACGLVGIVFAFKGRSDIAFYFMLGAAVADFLDGFAARLLDAYSDLGKELDSLCDVVSFGVLPSVMLFNVCRDCMFGESIVCYFCLIIAVFAALRLAKFNISTDQSNEFKGLPAPAAALLTGALCCHVAHTPDSILAMWLSAPVFPILFSLGVSLLMICRLGFFSMKFHRDDEKSLVVKRISFIVIAVASVVVCCLFHYHFSLGILLAFSIYILKNIIYRIFGL